MKLKWIAAMTLAVSAVFTTFAFAAENKGFSDVDFSTEQGKAIEKMYSVGYLKGYNDGSFKPEATITRAELTRVFNQVFDYKLNEEKASSMEKFSDVEESAWYYNDVRIAQSNGYINGFNDNTFRPQDNFTRQQTCVVLALAAGLQSPTTDIVINDEVSPWAEAYVKASIADGAFKLEEGNKFRGTVNITRGEVCQALAKYVVIESEIVTNEQGEAVTNAEGETETSTKVVSKQPSGNSGSGTSGGGNSSNNNNSNNTVVTTESSTEKTTAEVTTSVTEATTEAVTKVTTEATTEATTEKVEIKLNDEEIAALKNVIDDTKYTLMYMVKTSDEKAVAQYMLNAMENYLADNSYDVSTAIGEAKQMYYALSAEERADFKNCLLSSYNMVEVSLLKDVFAPFL